MGTAWVWPSAATKGLGCLLSGQSTGRLLQQPRYTALSIDLLVAGKQCRLFLATLLLMPDAYRYVLACYIDSDSTGTTSSRSSSDQVAAALLNQAATTPIQADIFAPASRDVMRPCHLSLPTPSMIPAAASFFFFTCDRQRRTYCCTCVTVSCSSRLSLSKKEVVVVDD